MPANASPEEWLAAGPWCFAGRETLFPCWEEEYLFAPEPLASGELLPEAAAAAQTLALLAIPELSASLTDKADQHSLLYWQTLLLPWSLAVSRQIVERAIRLDALIEAFGAVPMRLAPLPDISFSFPDEASFMLHGCLNPLWNHWLFAQMLRERMPKAWEWLPCNAGNAPAGEVNASQPLSGAKLTLRQRFASHARRLILKLPFPPLKGMNLFQALRFSFALRKYNGAGNSRQDLAREYCKPEILEKFPIPANWLDLMLACLPDSLKNLNHDKHAESSAEPRLRVASVRAHEDASYRQELALWAEGGNHLAYVQHGCNYGQVKVACDAPLLEYSHNLFFSWGWDQYSASRGNFIPMPYPQLARIAKAWKGGEANRLIFVGTEMAAAACRLDSHPTPLQVIAYRKAKAGFFASLPEDILASSYYRPYFRLPGCLDDEEWLLPRFPELKRCEGPLLPQILKCRLLVIDHPGTTMLEAFSAGIPLIAYWDRRYWRLCEECDRLLFKLEKCGAWQPNPQKAAEMAAKIWHNPAAWLNSREVSDAYESWRNWQAQLPEGALEKVWIEKLESL